MGTGCSAARRDSSKPAVVADNRRIAGLDLVGIDRRMELDRVGNRRSVVDRSFAVVVRTGLVIDRGRLVLVGHRNHLVVADVVGTAVAGRRIGLVLRNLRRIEALENRTAADREVGIDRMGLT